MAAIGDITKVQERIRARQEREKTLNERKAQESARMGLDPAKKPHSITPSKARRRPERDTYQNNKGWGGYNGKSKADPRFKSLYLEGDN
jgi:hypothetical protein